LLGTMCFNKAGDLLCAIKPPGCCCDPSVNKSKVEGRSDFVACRHAPNCALVLVALFRSLFTCYGVYYITPFLANSQPQFFLPKLRPTCPLAPTDFAAREIRR
jgi:hypothetical protein